MADDYLEGTRFFGSIPSIRRRVPILRVLCEGSDSQVSPRTSHNKADLLLRRPGCFSQMDPGRRNPGLKARPGPPTHSLFRHGLLLLRGEVVFQANGRRDG
jgi:hypothetical protein